MSGKDIKAVIKRHEGLRLKPYYDSVGVITIGWGRNLEKGITQEEAEFLFTGDFYQAQRDLVDIFPNFLMWSEPVRTALMSMMFNLGKPRFTGFRKMIEAIEAGDWGRAVAEMEDSKWARQVPGRFEEIKKLILENT